ncbi:hypothetical protein [Pseudarthrobacter sp. N5]|uniref:hypothetical protein n=1 Tax=Pseudarthrobacter sp. N5 TaxID=3418416 RepID=UPI003CF863E6
MDAFVCGLPRSLLHLPIAALILVGSTYLPLARIGSGHDISYGIYIYGFPVEQILAMTVLMTVVTPQ